MSALFHLIGSLHTISGRCMIVKTEPYSREEVGKVVQLRAGIEGLSLGEGVVTKLSGEGEKASLRCVLRSLGL